MIDFSKHSSSLTYRDGIWHASAGQEISYPKTGNKDFFALERVSFWFSHRNDVIGKLVGKYAAVPKVFLDVGAGNGFTTQYLEACGFESVVLEPGWDGALNSKARGLQHVIHSTLYDAKFAPGTFSNIGLFDVVEHIEDDHAFLEEIKRILLPGGRIFITVPAFNFLWSQNDTNAGHFRRYTRKSFAALADRVGLKVLYSTYFFSVLPFSIFILRSIPYRFGYRFKNLLTKATREHKRSSLSFIFDAVWRWELNRIPETSLRCGSSCFVVVEKPHNA